MKNEDVRILKKSIQSISTIIVIFVIGFLQVPRVLRDIEFYYYLTLISCGVLAFFFSDIILKPSFKNMGQKLAFYSIPVVYIGLIFICRVVSNIFNVPLAYFIVITLFILVGCSSALKEINKVFTNINELDEKNKKLKVVEGIGKIRMQEIGALIQQNNKLNKDTDLKYEFELLYNAIIYGNYSKVDQAEGINKAINENIEILSQVIQSTSKEGNISEAAELIKKIRLMIQERDRIVQLYYN